MKKLEKHHKDLQEKSRIIDRDLKLKTDKLEKKKLILSQDDYDKQEKQLQNEFEKYAQNYHNDREQFQQQFRKEAELYDKNLAKIIKAIAEKQKYTYVLQSQNLLYYNSIMDITGIVLLELNKVLPLIGD
jgi:Skp family chaperone for outer membrane proteins